MPSRHARVALAVALLSAAAPMVLADASTSASASYVGPTTPFAPRVDCFDGVTSCVGGAVFPPGASAPTRVDVLDVSTRRGQVIACQDLDLNGACGETEEPRIDECGTHVTIDLTPAGFRADLPTTVFIIATGRCGDAVAAAGTITLHYG